MRVLVMGCGSIGERHIRNMQKIGNLEIIACDSRQDRVEKISKNYEIKEVYTSLKEALDKHIIAALVCTPSSTHIPIALAAVNKGVHVFIEKPLSDNLEGIDELLTRARINNRILMVGFNLRFHPCLRRIKSMLDNGTIGKIICAKAQVGQYLPDWHPWEDYRTTYSAQKSLGGGVILDAIHEYDYIRWFLGDPSEVFCYAGKLSSLEIDAEDIAETLMLFNKRAIAEILTDYIQRVYSRSCQLIGDEGTILWNFKDNIVHLFTAKDKQWHQFPENNFDFNETYVMEIKHFLECIQSNKQPLTSALDGKKVLEIALAAKRSAESGQAIVI